MDQECTCPVKNGKTQCIGIGSPNSNNTVFCKKARRQQQSAEALERQREEARNAPPKPDPEMKISEILAGLIEMLLALELYESDRKRLEEYQVRMSVVLYG